LIQLRLQITNNKDKKQIRALYSTNQLQNQNQPQLGHKNFPALGASYREFASSSNWFIVLLWFALIGQKVVDALILVLG